MRRIAVSFLSLVYQHAAVVAIESSTGQASSGVKEPMIQCSHFPWHQPDAVASNDRVCADHTRATEPAVPRLRTLVAFAHPEKQITHCQVADMLAVGRSVAGVATPWPALLMSRNEEGWLQRRWWCCKLEEQQAVRTQNDRGC